MNIANDKTEAPYTPWCVYKDGLGYFTGSQDGCLKWMVDELPGMTAAQAAIWGFTIERYRRAAA